MLPPADASALLATTELLCRADTTTGRENAGLPALRELLAAAGAEVTLQEVENGRHNVLATWGTPRLLFSTHLDTVPPYIAPTLADGVLRGRGACDAETGFDRSAMCLPGSGRAADSARVRGDVQDGASRGAA